MLAISGGKVGGWGDDDGDGDGDLHDDGRW